MSNTAYDWARGRDGNNIFTAGVIEIGAAGVVSGVVGGDFTASLATNTYTITVDNRFPPPKQAFLQFAQATGFTVVTGLVVTDVTGQTVTFEAIAEGSGTVAPLTSGDKVHVLINCPEILVGN
jgi:hypothetical protein